MGYLLGMLLAAITTGCRDRAAAPAWSGTITDSAGVAVVANTEQGMWSGDEAWRVEEDLRIGSFGGDLSYVFGEIGTVAVNGAGEILVSDRQSQAVRVFSPTGVYLREIGRPGSGPGELAFGATTILLAPGGRVLIPDVRNRRISRFSPDGESLGSAALNPGRERPLRYYQSTSGDMAVQVRSVEPDVGSEPRDAIRVVNADGTFGDTLLLVPTGGLFEGAGVRYFTAEPMWALADSSKLLYGINDTYSIETYTRDGLLRRVVKKSFELDPITDRDTRAIFSFLNRAWLDAGVPPSRLSENRSRVSFAGFFPAFSEFHVGVEGSLWVQRVQPPGGLSEERMERYNFAEDFGAPDWEVFDAEGRYLGTVAMPQRFQPRIFRGDAIYGVGRDEYDVQYVVRLRVVKGSAAPV